MCTLVPSLGIDIAQNHNTGRCSQEFVQPRLLHSAVSSTGIPSLNAAEVTDNANGGSDCCGSKGFSHDETNCSQCGGSVWQPIVQKPNSFGSSLWKLL